MTGSPFPNKAALLLLVQIMNCSFGEIMMYWKDHHMFETNTGLIAIHHILKIKSPIKIVIFLLCLKVYKIRQMRPSIKSWKENFLQFYKN